MLVSSTRVRDPLATPYLGSLAVFDPREASTEGEGRRRFGEMWCLDCGVGEQDEIFNSELLSGFETGQRGRQQSEQRLEHGQ